MQATLRTQRHQGSHYNEDKERCEMYSRDRKTGNTNQRKDDWEMRQEDRPRRELRDIKTGIRVQWKKVKELKRQEASLDTEDRHRWSWETLRQYNEDRHRYRAERH